MQIFVEESGRYAMDSRRGFESSVLLGLIVPDRCVREIESFASALRARLGKAELKSSRLRPSAIVEVCEFIASQPIAAVAFVTDSVMMSQRWVEVGRARQIAQIEGGLSRYRRGSAAADPSRVAEAQALIQALRSEISDVEFAQQQQIPELLFETVQRAVDRYRDAEWDSEFQRMLWVIDAKLPNTLSPGERYAHEHGLRAVGSTERFVLTLPFEWQTRPDHPFLRRYAADAEHTSLNLLWEHARRYDDSKRQDGLQLADVAAGVIRRAVTGDKRAPTRSAYDKLRMTLTDMAGECLRLYRFRGAPDPDPARYQSLMRAWPATDAA